MTYVVSPLIPDTEARAEDVNANLNAIAAELTNIALAINRALKAPASEGATDIMTLASVAAARANKLLMFGSTGAPAASMTMPADVNMDGHGVTGSRDAAAAAELTTLSQVQALITMGGSPADVAIDGLNQGALPDMNTVIPDPAGTGLIPIKLSAAIDVERAIRRGRAAAAFLR